MTQSERATRYGALGTMKTGILLLLLSAFFLYLGAAQVMEVGSVAGSYPASLLLGSFAPGLALLLAALRRLNRFSGHRWHVHHLHF